MEVIYTSLLILPQLALSISALMHILREGLGEAIATLMKARAKMVCINKNAICTCLVSWKKIEQI